MPRTKKTTYSIYDLITMPMWEATELLFEETKIINPYMDLVRDLFEYAVLDVNLQDNEYRRSALMWASYRGHTEIVKGLLERPEILVNLKDKDGRSALMWASELGRTEIVKMLLEHPEIDVNLQDEEGVTALMRASFLGHTEIVRGLLERPEILVNLQNGRGETALHVASEWGQIEIIELLLKHPKIDRNKKCSINKRFVDYMTEDVLLHYVEQFFNIE